jgi:hypothetical protein
LQLKFIERSLIFIAFFLQATELVLNILHISEPYKTIGFIVWSNKCKFALMLAAEPDKHLLNVHDGKSSNIAVLSEIGRFPIYFNIVLSMISYLHRLHHCSSNLLKEAFLYKPLDWNITPRYLYLLTDSVSSLLK